MSALEKFMKKSGGVRKSGISKSGKKPAGRPKIPSVEGCEVWDPWLKNRHGYTQGSKVLECCKKCGKENEMVTAWRKRITEGEFEDHPYIVRGYWSRNEHKKAMKR